MKTLVIQANIKSGSESGTIFWKNEEQQEKNLTHAIVENVCIPSVKAWALRNGYDYRLLTKASGFKFFDQPGMPWQDTVGEYLLHMHQEDYDRVIKIDNDFYATDDAPEFPEVNGICGVAFPSRMIMRSDAFGTDDYIPAFDLVNKHATQGGLLAASKDAGKQLVNYFKLRIKEDRKISDPRIRNDEGLLYEFYQETDVARDHLPTEWNHCMWYTYDHDTIPPYFVHFNGPFK